jgi:uncharacterized membrane protein
MSTEIEKRLAELEQLVGSHEQALESIDRQLKRTQGLLTLMRSSEAEPLGERESRAMPERSFAPLEPQPPRYEAATPSRPTPPPPAEIAAPSLQKPRAVQLEELLGGRLLAWAGGIAVVLGVAFFVALAMKRGWIDEQTRILLSFLGSIVLGGTGVWLHERKGRTQASLAMVGTSIAALYLTLTAAAQLYDLISVGPGLAIAFLIGATATTVAVRWDSPVVAGLGIVGALLAPVLVGADMTNGSLAFVLIALASAVGVLLWRRWDWLAVAAFVVSAPQLLAWAFSSPAPAGLALGLTSFWLLTVAASLGYEMRVSAAGLRASSTLLLIANAGVAALGYTAFREIDQGTAADVWICLLAVTHIGVGLAALASKRVAREIGVLGAALGVLLADLALGLTVSGPALAAGWAAGATPFVLMGRQEVGGIDLRRVALVWQLVLATAHVLGYDAEPITFVEGTDHMVGGILALGALAAAYIGCARRLSDEEHRLRNALDGAGLAALAYMATFALDGVALTAAWAGGASVLTLVGRRFTYVPAPLGAAAFIALALGHVLAFEAPPDSLVYGVGEADAAFLGIAIVALAAIGCSRFLTGVDARLKLSLDVLGGALLVYLGSVGIVDSFQPDSAFDTGLDLEIRQQGQAFLSGFWSVAGLAALVYGLMRNSRVLRLGGFTLLGLAVSKVFLYDLSTLESLWRVLSFVALGLLLLAGALAYQRMQPPEASDLRHRGVNAG